MRGLSKRYRGVTALAELSLEVPAGSIVGFLGPNGAGKTTALKILAGLTRADAGAASIDGVPVSVQGEHRSRVGYAAQDPRFYPWMTGRQVVSYVASFFGPGPAAHFDSLLDLVGLSDAADRPTRTYSGGMRQRLGIAQALAGDPPVLLLDEPAAALDPIGRRDVLELMRRLRGEKTIFYSTHILDDVERVSDHVAIIDRGRLVVSAPTTELMNSSRGRIVRVALLGAGDDTRSALASLAGVESAADAGRDGDERRFDLTPVDGRVADVQAAVMRHAASAGLIITTNRPENVDLEAVFLKILNEERAA